MRIYQNELMDLKNLLHEAAMRMTLEIVIDPDWLNVLHPDNVHPLEECLSELTWYNDLITVYPQHKDTIVEECRMQLEAADKAKGADLPFLFAVSDRETCCLSDAIDRMTKYEFLEGLDLEDEAYNLASNSCSDDWLLDYVDFDKMVEDLRMYGSYSEHDGGVLRRI
jgi:hypothetical protein